MKSKTKIYLIMTYLVLFISLSSTTLAQINGEDVSGGKKVKIFSKVLNEERPIYISLPSGYEQSMQRYPVVYVLDGTIEKLLSSGGLIRYLSYYEMPQMITVFIPNTTHDSRIRDLTISKTPIEQTPNFGADGGVRFSNFLTKELISYIDSIYRTTNYRIITGYSLSGAFAFNALLTMTDYFDAYIATSPPIRFEKELLEKTTTFFQNHKTLNKFLYLPFYERDLKTTTLIIPKLEKIIKDNYPKGFRFEVKKYSGQGHVPNTALYDGLMLLFEGWGHVKVPEIIPSNGLIQDGKSIKVELKGYDTYIRYTLDGTEPTEESILYTEPITITQPVTLKAKSFRSNLSESDIVSAEYKNGPDLFKVMHVSNLQAGIHYKYFEKSWWILPDSVTLEPKKQGVIKTFNISNRDKNEGFIFQFDGFLNISKEGSYRFYLLSTARSKMLLGNKMIIDDNFTKSWADPLYEKEEYSYGVYLTPGYYPTRVLYTNASHHGADFQISYEGPEIKKQEIPTNILFHKTD